jgi:hypothetical protein
MKFDVLYNFISPVTGRILSDPDYVLVGDLGGIAMPSPILIDIRLDIIALRKDLNIISDASFIIGFPNESLPNAQVLNTLADGYVFNTAGIVSTTPIADIGNVMGPDPAISTPDHVVLWDGDTGRKVKDSDFSIADLEALAAEAEASALEALNSASKAVSAASSAVNAAANVANVLATLQNFGGAAAAGGIAGLFGGLFGGLIGGRRGGKGTSGLPGVPGAEGVSGKTTLIMDANLSILGGRIQDLTASPEADYDAVNAKWVWDLLNDNVEIKWG